MRRLSTRSVPGSFGVSPEYGLMYIRYRSIDLAFASKSLCYRGCPPGSVTFLPRKQKSRLRSSQLCPPAPVNGIRALDRSISCTSASQSVPFRSPKTDLRSVRDWSEITEIVNPFPAPVDGVGAVCGHRGLGAAATGAPGAAR